MKRIDKTMIWFLLVLLIFTVACGNEPTPSKPGNNEVVPPAEGSPTGNNPADPANPAEGSPTGNNPCDKEIILHQNCVASKIRASGCDVWYKHYLMVVASIAPILPKKIITKIKSSTLTGFIEDCKKTSGVSRACKINNTLAVYFGLSSVHDKMYAELTNSDMLVGMREDLALAYTTKREICTNELPDPS